VIIYLHRSRWRPGQRLAMGGATAALAVALAWASFGDRGSMRGTLPAISSYATSAASEGQENPSTTTATSRHVAARTSSGDSVSPQIAVVPPAPPFRYVGHWKEHRETTVVLSDRGRNLLVRVPGAFDDRYQVLAVDEHRLVLKYLPLGIVQTLALSPGAPWIVGSAARSAPPTPATPTQVVEPAPIVGSAVQPARPTLGTLTQVSEPAPQVTSSGRRKKATDEESSMEAPGLPAMASPAYGATAQGAAEPEN
jgi:hypothetical protein